jgi:intracellular multiplication protein IcmE
VSGEFKGAKLLGSIKTTNNGQRVMLQLNLMTMNAWVTGKSINAFVIDPDTARSAIATDVNNHYLLRYGSLFAASFISGMGQAVEDSGTEVTSDDGVVTSSTSDLNTEEKVLVALGTVGESASSEVNKLVNTPPTVKIKSGIGVGILFMGDVSDAQATPVPAAATPVAAPAAGSATTPTVAATPQAATAATAAR